MADNTDPEDAESIDIKRLFDKPEYETRGRRFMNFTPWKLNNLNKEAPFSISMSGSGDNLKNDFVDQWIKALKRAADKKGFVAANQFIPREIASTENPNVGWDVHEMKADRDADDQFTAHNFKVSAGIRLEQDGVTDMLMHDWQGIKRMIMESCNDGLNAGGMLSPDLKASVYRRADGTICVQIFYSFLFNEDIINPAFDLNTASLTLEKLIKQIHNYSGDSYEEYEVSINEM
jgi:hypothetical protein